MQTMEYASDRGQATHARIESVMEIALTDGRFDDGRHEIFTSSLSTVSVRDLRTGMLVAHSTMKADFENSLVEFVTDYFT